jgi:hypothetical protein
VTVCADIQEHIQMTDQNQRWRELAEQASKEQNPEKLFELAKQIDGILNDEHDSKHKSSGTVA